MVPLFNQATRVGIIFPTLAELEPFLKLVPDLQAKSISPWQVYSGEFQNLSLQIVVSYIGPANAAAATEHLMSYKPQTILHGGAAGAINPDLMPGDVVVGQTYKIICSKPILEVRRNLLLSNKGIRFLQDGSPVHLEELRGSAELLKSCAEISPEFAAGHPVWNSGGWPETHSRRAPKIVLGSIGSQDGWTKDRAELDFIRNEFKVDTEDMESAYVAQIAAKHKISFLAVRAISNNEYIGCLSKQEIFPAVSEAASRVADVLVAICGKIAER